MMYKIRVLTSVLFFLVSGSFVLAQPKAVIKPLAYDFGEIIQDSVVSTIFVITNVGTDVLKINEVKASCGCTAVVAGKNELNPGESTEIKVSFDSEGKHGMQNKTITVSTNDPNNRKAKLAITGEVIKSDSKTGKLGEANSRFDSVE